MIGDAMVEVTCDGPSCMTSEYIGLPAGVRNTYLFNETEIEKSIKDGLGWICDGLGQHFCCEDCEKEFEDNQ